MMQYDLFSPPPPRAEPPADLFDDDLFSEPPPALGDPDGLRWYQRQAIERVRESFQSNRSALVVMATALGKTVTFGALAKHWPGRILVLAHREELVWQARETLERMTGELVEIEKAEYSASLRARIVCGSNQTLLKRMEKFGPEHFSLVIQDEAHHAVAPSFRTVLDYFASAKVFGVTATPDRADEAALGQVFDDVPFIRDIEDGIEDGYLVPVIGTRVELREINLDDVGKTAGDLAAGQLDEAMWKGVEGIVRKTLELGGDRQGIAFFPGVKSAEYAMLKFNELLPGSACFISGDTDPDERRQITKDFRAGLYRYLCNCAIATEGFDAPSVSLIIQGRPTLSRALYTQMIGRGTRILPGLVDHLYGQECAAERRAIIAASQKPNTLILDFVGNGTKHSLIGPEDALGGNYTPVEVEEAKRISKKNPGGDVRTALREARRVLKELAEKTKAKVQAAARPFDPFHAMGIDCDQEERYVSRFGGRPATEGQLNALRLAGVPEEELSGMTKRAAGKLLDHMKKRRKKKLATYKQMRQLKKFGIIESDISFERASAALNYISSKGWGRKGAVDPRALYDIVRHVK